MNCTRCQLHTTAQTYCGSRGVNDPLILFVGEGPGKEENREGVPFVGPAGQKLDSLMQRVGLDPAWCRWTNLVKCIPWESFGYKVRPPEDLELDACCLHLEPEILQTQPVFIVPLGAAATSYFLGPKTAISKARGKRYVVEMPTVRYRYRRMREILARKGIQDESLIQITPATRERAIKKAIKQYGFKDVPTKQFTLFPSWHPAAILYGNPRAEQDLLSDLNFLVSRVVDKDDNLDYRLITDVDEAVFLLRRLREEHLAGKFPYLSYDLETTSLDSFNPEQYITTIGFTDSRERGYVIPWDHHESPFKNDMLAQTAIKNSFNQLFEDVPICGHNLKFDIEFGLMRGLHVRNVFDDTQEQSWTLFNDQSPHDLDFLTSRYTDLNLPKQEMREAQEAFPKAERYNTDNYDLDLIYRYNAADVDSVQRLEPVLRQMLIRDQLYDSHRFFTVGAIIPTVAMEVNGCPVDLIFHQKLFDDMTAEIEGYYGQLDQLGVMELMNNAINDPATPEHKRKTFKLSSSQQVSHLLFDILEFEPRKLGKVRKAGALKGQRVPSSDKNVLLDLWEESNEYLKRYESDPTSGQYQIWKLRHDVVSIIRDYKLVEQLFKMNVKNLRKKLCIDGYMRPDFGIRHTETGRFNCKGRGLPEGGGTSYHTIPWHSPVKKMYVSRFENGVILAADHAQMELRVFAMATGDEELIATFKAGKDIHRMIAARVLQCAEEDVPPDERRRMKTVNFGLLYGRGPRSIAAQEAISVERAKELIAGVFRQFPRIKDYVATTHAFVRKYGHVRYINGFRRLIPVDQQDPSRAERQSVNSSIQGPASDLALAGLINIHQRIQKLQLNSKLFEFKHDDLGFDVAPGELHLLATLLRKEMVDRVTRQFPFINVPLKVDFELGVTWGHLVEMSLMANNMIEVTGEDQYVDPLLEQLLGWQDAPDILSKNIEVKKKTAVVRSLQRSTGEMVDYNHVTATMQFPPFVRREPNYRYPGLTTWYGHYGRDRTPEEFGAFQEAS